jgi:hypothetical protein
VIDEQNSNLPDKSHAHEVACACACAVRGRTKSCPI